MIRVHAALSLVLAASLFACGGSAENPGGGGSGANGGSGGSGASGGSGGDDGKGGGYCDVPPDLPGPNVTVRLVNKTGQNLYLGDPQQSCDSYRAFEVVTGDGKTLKSSLGSCEFTCSDLLAGQCQCAADCAAPVVTLLAADGVYTAQWDGSIFSSASLNTGCATNGCSDGACIYQEPATGPLGLVGGAYLDVMGCDPGPCSCTPDANGTCLLDYPATVTGTKITASATITQVTATTVDIVFDALPGG